MSETKWEAGWGQYGITGGNCPSGRFDDHGKETLFAGGPAWPYTIVRDGDQVVAVVPAAYDPSSPCGVATQPIAGTELERARVLAAAPDLMRCALLADEALSNACDPVQDSNDPLESLRFMLRAAIAKARGE